MNIASCKMPGLWVALLLIFCVKNAVAQDSLHYQFVAGSALTVAGRSDRVEANAYHRIAAADLQTLPKRVAELATNAAGINITFQTNSRNIKVKWILGKYNQLWNMTPLAVNGMDLYGWSKDHWQYVASARPVADTNAAVLVNNLDGEMRAYRLYLPLYAEVKELQIGVDAAAIIQKAAAQDLPEKKVVIYGSSITQGASASRPGMAYPSLIARHLNVETFNMGFSGSGKMEMAVADVLAKMDADVYVLDCVPNPSPKEIQERAVPFIRRLRNLKPGIPIILVESIFREDGNWNGKKGMVVTNQNKEFRKAYEQLAGEKFHDLYYISSTGLIGDDHEATVDGTHLTDLGFTRLAKHIEDVLMQLFKKLPQSAANSSSKSR